MLFLLLNFLPVLSLLVPSTRSSKVVLGRKNLNLIFVALDHACNVGDIEKLLAPGLSVTNLTVISPDSKGTIFENFVSQITESSLVIGSSELLPKNFTQSSLVGAKYCQGLQVTPKSSKKKNQYVKIFS